MIQKPKFLLCLILATSTASAISVDTSGIPANATATLTISEPIRFDMAATPFVGGNVSHPNISFIFDQAAFPHDGTKTDVAASGLYFTINDDPTQYPIHKWRDNLATSSGNVTPNDAQITNTDDAPFTLVNGDYITLSSGTLTMNASVNNFNLFDSGDYTVFVSGIQGNRLSGDGYAVPEPETATLLLGGIALAKVLLRRTRRRA